MRDTTTVDPEPNSRLVFVPGSVYTHLVERFHSAEKRDINAIAHYLTVRASDEFLLATDARSPELLDRALATEPEPEGYDSTPELAIRLRRSGGDVLFDSRRSEIVTAALTEAVENTGWSRFLEVEGFRDILPDFCDGFLRSEIANGFNSTWTLYSWYAEDLSSSDHVDGALDAIESHTERLKAALVAVGLASEHALTAMIAAKTASEERLYERRSEIDEKNEQRAEYEEDFWRERQAEERYEVDNGPFADVDE